jgi:hypothetical protein
MLNRSVAGMALGLLIVTLAGCQVGQGVFAHDGFHGDPAVGEVSDWTLVWDSK